jgi:hypothetical protein
VADSATGTHSIQAWTGLAVSFGNATAALLPEAGPLRLPLCLAFACLGPGCALLAHARVGDTSSAWALALGLSLAVVALTSTVMACAGWWHPAIGSAALAAVCAASCVTALARGVVIAR